MGRTERIEALQKAYSGFTVVNCFLIEVEAIDPSEAFDESIEMMLRALETSIPLISKWNLGQRIEVDTLVGRICQDLMLARQVRYGRPSKQN